MVIQALRPFLLAYLPSLLIDELTRGRRIVAIIAYVAAVIAGEGVLGLLVQELQKPGSPMPRSGAPPRRTSA